MLNYVNFPVESVESVFPLNLKPEMAGGPEPLADPFTRHRAHHWRMYLPHMVEDGLGVRRADGRYSLSGDRLVHQG